MKVLATSLRLSASLFLVSQVACDVLQLTEENFDSMTQGKTVFLKFFAPWCGHCKAMAPAWEKLAEDWKDHKVGLVAEIDCDSEEGRGLCEEYDVQGFPTLIYGDPHSPEQYEGGREYEELAEFAKEHISKPVCSVRNLDFCSDDHKNIIKSLKEKSIEELQKIESDVAEAVQTAQEKYDAGLEDLNARYEAIVSEFNTQVDKVREESNFKWVQQILREAESDKETKEEL